MSEAAIHNAVLPQNARWHGRAALTLTNNVVAATVLPGGGHIAAWRFAPDHGPTQQNVLWQAPWTTADPGTPEHTAISAHCGDDKGAAQFLASYTGHTLCLDGFGPAGAADAAAGVPLHGEAANATWHFAALDASSASGSVELPAAGLRVERQFSLAADESVLRVTERVINLRATERALHWVQHATIGTPFFAAGAGRVTASVREGITWPLDYDGANLLARDASFTWPWAPAADGERVDLVDLRTLFSRSGSGFLAATRQTRDREHGFVAACHADTGLAVGYVFRADVFPWMTFWEENRARHAAPWHSTVQARGLEFGTTPLPLGNSVVDARGPLFGTPTSRKLAGHETAAASWLLFLAVVPRTWREIEDVSLETDAIVLQHQNQRLRVAARGVTSLLGKAGIA